MTKKITALILLLAFMAQTFDKAVIYLDFTINRDFIAKVLCINKAKPQSTCQGTCQLKKKMEEETKKDKSNPDRKSENKMEIISPAFVYSTELLSASTANNLPRPYNLGSPVDISLAFFHPPC